MTSGNRSRTLTVTDEPVDIRSARSDSLAFIVRGDDPVAVLNDENASYDDAGKVRTNETYEVEGLEPRDHVWVVCDTGTSSDIDIFEGGVG